MRITGLSPPVVFDQAPLGAYPAVARGVQVCIEQTPAGPVARGASCLSTSTTLTWIGQAAAILSHLSPASASLPDDRSLWPLFLSGGLVPPPAAVLNTDVTPTHTGTPSPPASSAHTRPIPSSVPASTATGGPRRHDSAIGRNGIAQDRPGVVGVPTEIDGERVPVLTTKDDALNLLALRGVSVSVPSSHGHAHAHSLSLSSSSSSARVSHERQRRRSNAYEYGFTPGRGRDKTMSLCHAPGTSMRPVPTRGGPSRARRRGPSRGRDQGRSRGRSVGAMMSTKTRTRRVWT